MYRSEAGVCTRGVALKPASETAEEPSQELASQEHSGRAGNPGSEGRFTAVRKTAERRSARHS
ncbi:MAG TPA: hypothetical protein VJ436_14910 [Anaerolineales bacterium]|nr:hypothetical protein [Anaerolineales bacterium]